MSKMTAKGTSSIAPLGEAASRESDSSGLVTAGMPSSILMLEASMRADPENTELSLQIAKAYQALASTHFETRLLLGGDDRDPSLVSDAVSAHERAVYYSRRFIDLKGISWSNTPETLRGNLAKSGDDQGVIDASFIAASGLKSIVAIQQKRPAYLTLLPLAETLSKFACAGSTRPSYPVWGCGIMRAVELAETPPLAGGDIKASRAAFQDILKHHPESLMPLALWAEHLLTKEPNPEDWAMIKEAAAAARKKSNERIFATAVGDAGAIPQNDESFLNSVALTRLDYMTRHEKKFFQ